VTTQLQLINIIIIIIIMTPKEIHTILRETLACFLPGQTKDLSAHMYI